MSKLKDRLSIFRDVLAISAILLAVLYTVSPATKRIIDSTFGYDALYYLGDFGVSVCPNAKFPVACEKNTHLIEMGKANFYHAFWFKNRFGVSATDEKAAVVAATERFKEIIGDIVYVRKRGKILPGRERPENSKSEFIEEKVITLIEVGDCLLADRVIFEDARSDTTKFPYNVHIGGVKVDCL